MINESSLYLVESKSKLAVYQSDFRKGRQTLNQVVCLEDEIRKAQANKEVRCSFLFMWRKHMT